MIKPIETCYNGYRFRSRLEARWAVFFESAGIEYEYEPEGFVLEDGTYYLPDFYLPWFKAYCEIKPKSISFEDRTTAMQKCEKLFCGRDCVVLYCEGDPFECQLKIFCTESDCDGGGTAWFDCDFFEGAGFVYKIAEKYTRQDPDWTHTKHFICIAVGPENDHKEREYFSSHWNYCCLEQKAKMVCCRSDFKFAKTEARQARFEHGEQNRR